MIELLTPIWERVLQRSPIGAEDNFFDLGGDPALANRLFAEIALECGRELSPLTICEAPTIAALAAILENPHLPRFSAAVPLRAGTKQPPIFMIPGLCSNVTMFSKFVQHFESGHPVFGMQPQGLDGVEEPFDRVEDFAQFYTDAIRTLQPRGPYVLVGYSFGGLVAFEMAQQLSKSGETIALLVMIDAYPHRVHLPFALRVRVVMRLAMRFIARMLNLAGFPARTSEYPEEDRPDTTKPGPKFAPIERLACRKNIQALKRYQPRYYKGKINFIRAAESSSDFPDDPIRVWARLADEFVAEIARGTHWGIITTHCSSLADIVLAYVKKLPQYK
jgi:acetoacetyl-CoA synthetase